MSQSPSTITDIPPAGVQDVCDSYTSEGAAVTKVLQADGNYTVTATWA